jgi:hypothetical protein
MTESPIPVFPTTIQPHAAAPRIIRPAQWLGTRAGARSRREDHKMNDARTHLRRKWKKKPEARAAVYRNRRRIRGARGLRLLRLRSERLERSFAHLYQTGGMRRVHLRGHPYILKRLLIHNAGFNLGLLMRQPIGVGTPRGL